MEKILSTQSQRYLKILDYLYYNESSTLENLVNLANTSSRTIREDINKINLFIKPLQIKRTTQFDYYLTHKNSISYDYVHSCVLSESLEFSVLETIFFEEENRLENYANSLFISISTLKRIIAKINKQFKKQGIKITSKPVQIIGDEGVIRNLMAAFFLEKYLDRETYLKKRDFLNSDNLNTIDTLISDFVEHKNITLEFPVFERLRLMIHTSLPRIQNEHYYSIPNIETLTKNYDTPIIHDKTFKENFKNAFNIELTTELFIDLVYPVANSLFTSKLTNTKDIHLRDTDSQKRLLSIDNLINDIINSFQIELDIQKRESLILKLFNMNLWPFPRAYLIYNSKHIFLMNLKNDFPLAYKFLDKKIISSPNFSNYEPFEIEEFIYILVTHWDNLLFDIQEHYQEFTVGVCMHSDIEHSLFLIQMLESEFKNRYTFEPLNYLTHGEAINNYDNYDVILTNVSTLKDVHPKVISIALYPSAYDLEKLYLTYYDLCFNKK